MEWYPRVERYDEHIAEVAAYTSALQPVHRCAPGVFLAILREGGLLSREELEELFKDSPSPEDLTKRNVLRTARHLRLQELGRDKRFAAKRRTRGCSWRCSAQNLLKAPWNILR